MNRRARWGTGVVWALLAAQATLAGLAGAQDLPDADAGGAPSSSPAVEETELPPITPGPPITLAEALTKADQRNLSLTAARLEVEKADAQLGQAWALVMPGAQASLQLLHRDHEDSFNFADGMPAGLVPAGTPDTVIAAQQDLKGTVQVGLPLINLQSWFTIRAAQAGVEAARLSIADARRQLLLGVAQAHHMAMMARTLIDLHESRVRSADHHLAVAGARLNAGTGLRIDVIRAETDREQARQELLAAHLAFDNARDVLRVLTDSDELPLPVEPPPLAAPSAGERELVEAARARRDDQRARRALVGVREAQLDASWMQLMPTLEAGWQLQYQFTEPGDLGSPDRSRWALMFTLSVPIYNHYRYADLDYRRAALRQAMIEQEAGGAELAREIRSARRDYLTALASLETAERQAVLTREALALVTASYEAGTGTSLEVTDARRTAAAAEVNLAAQRLRSQIALLVLLAAVGDDLGELAR